MRDDCKLTIVPCLLFSLDSVERKKRKLDQNFNQFVNNLSKYKNKIMSGMGSPSWKFGAHVTKYLFLWIQNVLKGQQEIARKVLRAPV